VIIKVDGSAPFTDGTFSPGVMNLLNPAWPQHQSVLLTLRWPVTGATRTITLTPARYNLGPLPPQVTSRLLAGHIGYLQLYSFPPNAGSIILAAISKLEKKAKLRGIILDLRGNAGGSPAGIASMAGLFEHGEPWATAAPAPGCAPPATPTATRRCCTCRWPC
jgi:carboxyl-terminal processing protease